MVTIHRAKLKTVDAYGGTQKSNYCNFVASSIVNHHQASGRNEKSCKDMRFEVTFYLFNIMQYIYLPTELNTFLVAVVDKYPLDLTKSAM